MCRCASSRGLHGGVDSPAVEALGPTAPAAASAGLVLAIFAMVMVVVNSWIAAMGMVSGYFGGAVDHLLLALSEVALAVFFLIAPEPEPITEP